MKLIMKRLSLLILLAVFSLPLAAQMLEPVKWLFAAKRISATEANIIFTATIEDGWYLYSQDLPDGEPVATNFNFDESDAFKLNGKVIEKQPIKKFDEIFKMELKYFKGKTDFTQKVVPASGDAFKVIGYLEFMCCDNSSCLPPTSVDFEITVPAFKEEASAALTSDPEKTAAEETDIDSSIEQSELTEEIPADEETIITSDLDEETPKTKTGLWYIFIAGLLGGLLALVTPCVFPMIPMTVSYFIRNTSNKAKGRTDALIYGISIVIIYVALGTGVSMIFGSDGLNQLSTSPYFNIFFFLLLIVFAAAFFGAFELQLPSSWTTAIDNKAEKTGGLIGVFLMALVLVLVSFSCTGPIIGTLLVEAAVSGNKLSPIIGMTGFSVALAIPFTLLAVFPSMLGNMPKSGGWLNSVKVVLAFLLLAFSLKFLMVADSVAQWGLMSRDVFIAIWIVIFSMLGFYLLGKLKFAHDDDLPYISVSRTFLAIISFSFVIYMIPGLWGAPLKSISSFAPSITTQSFNLNRPAQNVAFVQGSDNNQELSAYQTKEGISGLIKFLDYEEGMEYAKKVGKPIFLDFTGHGCANCKKMEAAVWSDPQVIQRLRDNYVIISLYIDDRTEIPKEKQYVSEFSGKRIRNIGNKWSDFQAQRYGVNSQPYYVLLDHAEKQLAKPYSFNTNVDQFIQFLDSGVEVFNK